MITGLVVKAISGFFYVEVADLGAIECKARGNLKAGKNKVKVGDYVEVLETEKVIKSVLPRKNDFVRPDIANVDTLFLVFSMCEPELNLQLLDKFLVMATMMHTEAVICISKSDLAVRKTLDEICDIYNKFYNIITFSAKTGENLSEIESFMAGRAIAFTGPSGCGKSTLINLILGSNSMETGDISEKTKRGKHTTRHSQIFCLKNGAKLFDTPGFTAFETAKMDELSLKHFYPEFEEYSIHCKYDNCNHINEPKCGVRDALDAGEIAKSRYESYYRQFLELAERNKKW